MDSKCKKQRSDSDWKCCAQFQWFNVSCSQLGCQWVHMCNACDCCRKLIYEVFRACHEYARQQDKTLAEKYNTGLLWLQKRFHCAQLLLHAIHSGCQTRQLHFDVARDSRRFGSFHHRKLSTVPRSRTLLRTLFATSTTAKLGALVSETKKSASTKILGA